jgi:hypothetical protein
MKHQLENRLSNAARNGDIKTVKSILNHKRVNVNWKDVSWQGTPFYLACHYGKKEIVSLLLSHPDVLVNEPRHAGSTPFLSACYHHRIDCAKLLIDDDRVDLNMRNNSGYSPLSVAAQDGSIEIIKYWIASGKKMDLGDPGDAFNDPIEQAKEYPTIVKILERVRDDLPNVTHEVRMELGWYHKRAAECYASIVFLCDGLLEIKKENGPEARFFRIASKLPLEIQMILCHRTIGSEGNNIPSKLTEVEFRILAKLWC